MQPNGKVLDLIAKLREMRIDRGCTPAEAANAAAKVEELLQRHQLSIFDVEKHVLDEDIVDEMRETRWKRQPSWVNTLAQAVAGPHSVEVLFRFPPTLAGRRYGNVRADFIGHESDAKVASYLFDTLSQTLQVMADKAARDAGIRQEVLYRKTKRGWERTSPAEFRNSFIQGAAEEIYARLSAEKEIIATASSRALVVVKDRAVKEYMARNFPGAERILLKGAYDGNAREEGKIAGRKVPLTKGIQESDRLALPASGPGGKAEV